MRLEIEAALARNIRIIPILIDTAKMPRADQLPASMAGLTRRQALTLSPGQFDYDTSRLLRVLDATLAELRTAQPGVGPTPPSPQEPRNQNPKEATQEPDERKSTDWKADLVSRSSAEALFRIYAGPRRFFLYIKRGSSLTPNALFINGERLPTSKDFERAVFSITDEYGEIDIDFKMTRAYFTEAFLNGLSFGTLRRIGRIRIAVDNVIVYEE